MCKYMFIENGANFEVFQPKINIQWPNIRIENKTTAKKLQAKFCVGIGIMMMCDSFQDFQFVLTSCTVHSKQKII